MDILSFKKKAFVRGYSSLRISEPGQIRRFIELLKQVFSCDAVYDGSFITGDGTMALGQSYSELEDYELEQRLKEGGLSFSDADGTIFGGSISNSAFCFETLTVKQSEINIVVEDSSLVEDATFMSKFSGLAKSLEELFQCNLTFCANQEDFNTIYNTKLGIGIGLLDVYWVTIFGAPFLEVLDLDVLSRLPVYRSEQLRSGAFLVQTTEHYHASLSRSGESVRSQIKEHIGEEFFVKNKASGQRRQGGEIGVWQIVKLIKRAKASRNQFNDISHAAKVRPKF